MSNLVHTLRGIGPGWWSAAAGAAGAGALLFPSNRWLAGALGAGAVLAIALWKGDCGCGCGGDCGGAAGTTADPSRPPVSVTGTVDKPEELTFADIAGGGAGFDVADDEAIR